MRNTTAVITTFFAALLFSSCGGGGGVSTPAPYQPHDPYSYHDPYYRYHDPYPYGYVRDPFAYSDPLVGEPYGAQAPRGISNLLSAQLAEFGGAFGDNLAELHQQPGWGERPLELLDYLFASNNVAEVPGGFGEGRALALRSDRDTVSFVTYGLLDPQMSSQVLSVEVDGSGSFARGPEGGLYVGVRQFGEATYRWYGPLTPNYVWRVDAARNSNLGRGSAAYVTLAVFNGDEARIDGVSVGVGSR